MPPTAPCPDWEYQHLANYQQILTQDLAVVIRALRLGQFTVERHGTNTRSVHRQVFGGLTPPGFSYFAGHYRGESPRCLKDYKVFIVLDPLVGVAPGDVATAMKDFADDLQNAAEVLDTVFAEPNAVVSADEKLYSAVVVAARVFQEFLTIHPYANGNGHLARFLVWLLMVRYGRFPLRWTIEPRPNATNYARSIYEHRRGDVLPLEQLILQSLI